MKSYIFLEKLLNMLKFIFWDDLSEIYSNVAAYEILLTVKVTVASTGRALSN